MVSVRRCPISTDSSYEKKKKKKLYLRKLRHGRSDRVPLRSGKEKGKEKAIPCCGIRVADRNAAKNIRKGKEGRLWGE